MLPAAFPNPLSAPLPSHRFSPTLSPLARGWPFPAPRRLVQAQALSGQAKRAELYREEAEALRERVGRLPRLQEELRRCRERLQAAEACKGQLEVSGGRGHGGGAWGGAGPTGEGVGREEQRAGVQKRWNQALRRPQ